MRADILVIGAGLAGLAAALEAESEGATVVVAGLAAGASHLAQGGLAAAGEDDSAERHAADTLAAGAGLTDPEAALTLTAAGPAAVNWLAASGVRFDVDRDGRPHAALEAAHSRPRVRHAGDRTGAAIMAALDRELSLRRRVTRLDRHGLVRLLGDGETCWGAVLETGSATVRVEAAATILATGGFAGLYARTVAPATATGGGLLAALRAGATLADLEFVQFHPTAFAGPGRAFLLTEALRGAGALVTGLDGERFLAAADPRAELAPRSVVARAIAERLFATGEPYVLLDARPIGREGLEREFPGTCRACAEAGIDAASTPIPIAPAAHYTMGGIVTDLNGRSGLPGLLAAGECARTGLHGANRLASNSLLEAVVMGRRAGAAALDLPFARGRDAGFEGLDRPSAGSSAARLIGELLDRNVGMIRSRAGLAAALVDLEAPPRSDRQELARLMAASALMRQESRGSHYLTDFPEPVPGWNEIEVRVRRDQGGEAVVELGPRRARVAAAALA